MGDVLNLWDSPEDARTGHFIVGVFVTNTVTPRGVIQVPAGFIPALRFRILTPLFDTLGQAGMKESLLKSRLVTQMELRGDEAILDFGCGTGTLCLLIKDRYPGCVVRGVDIDSQILGIAREKAHRRGVEIPFDEYDGISLPYRGGSFDAVVSSLVFHHLSGEEKIRVLREIHRVLKRGGALHIMDFGIPRTRYARIMAFFLKHLEPTRDNILGRIPGYLAEAGFEEAGELHHEETIFGSVSFWQARRP